ncbi:nicotinamide riboside transporter PnuC [Rhodocaloribacter litoris]|uniref:nicotinamide riboside transporter PnuC n=1 Tax=Rhodocaloribacter litoris TaxID=2558931 RepID=UPI001E57CCE8|nr:nicotinamide riboside transporter PnuC [Rhodocaloribacter litoris]QXD16973.1 nicotinamide riboside transporter PnuC [Rhodocaloribacter litoris]
MELFQELFIKGFNLLEVVGFTAGLLYVLLNIRQNVWCWPAGLVSVTAYLIVFWEVRLYADMGLQVFYIGLSLYGWYYWLHGGRDDGEAPVVRLARRQAAVAALLGLAGTALMGYLLARFTDADLPYWDSATTVFSLVATWMTARKILENWLLWIAVDTLYVFIYVYKGLYLTSVLFALYLVLATTGYFAWKRTMPAPEPA